MQRLARHVDVRIRPVGLHRALAEGCAVVDRSWAGRLELRLDALRLDSATVGLISFGTETRVRTSDATHFHVNLPLQGGVLSRMGSGAETVEETVKALNAREKITRMRLLPESATYTLLAAGSGITPLFSIARNTGPSPSGVCAKCGDSSGVSEETNVSME